MVFRILIQILLATSYPRLFSATLQSESEG